jgi:thiamine-monophosphate kinase
MLGLMMKRRGELGLIEDIRASGPPPRNSAVALGIGDDCAILRPRTGHEILVTTDFTLEGRHFRRDWHPPESVGHRALARGLSDLAVMGGRPMAAFLSLALPAESLSTASGRKWVDRFFAGLRALAAQHDLPLAGGDTSESPTALVLADIVLVGSAPAGRAIRRSGGRAGDILYVTGALGGAAAELATLSTPGKRNPSPSHPQLYPQPRLAVGQALLRRRLATAAIDLSDGLSTDLAHLCRESAVGAEVSEAVLPIHPLAAEFGPARALDLALNGGEDYELLFTAPLSVRMPRSIAGVPITRIGRLVRGTAITIVDSSCQTRALEPGGWEHFTRPHGSKTKPPRRT